MRPLTSRYAGQCARCSKDYAPGDAIMYDKPSGCYCIGCEPTTPDELRAFRQAKLDRKDAKREEWAQARERRAEGYQQRIDTLMRRDASGRADWALVTQPGHIPQRAQANRAQERAWEEQRAADEHRARKSVMPARVAGDKARQKEAERDAVRELVRARVGTMVHCHPYGLVKLLRVNAKSATVETPRGFRDRVDLRWVDLTRTEA